MKHALATVAAAAICSLAACSDSVERDGATPTASESTPAATANAATSSPATPAASNPVGRRLALEGLADLVIGQPVPAGSGFAERGAQINETCRTITSPAYPGVYAIVEDGRVRRITVGERSDVKLVEGIGVGASEAEVLRAFPGFRAAPHKYVAAPGKYLTQPGSEPRLRFEMGEDGLVALIHAGLMPQLGYVEGCA